MNISMEPGHLISAVFSLGERFAETDPISW